MTNNIEELKEKIAKLIEDRFRQPAKSAGLVWDKNFNYMLATDIVSLEPLASLLKLLEQTRETCPECGGMGGWKGNEGEGDTRCELCHGTGKTGWNIERLAVLDKDQKPPKLVSLTGEASVEEKAAYLLGVEDVKEQMFKVNFKKIKEVSK